MLFQILAPTPARVFVTIQSGVFPMKTSSWRGSGVVIAISTWQSERAIDAIGGAESLETSCIRIEERLKYSIDIGIILDEMNYVKYVIAWVRNLAKFIRRTTPLEHELLLGARIFFLHGIEQLGPRRQEQTTNMDR